MGRARTQVRYHRLFHWLAAIRVRSLSAVRSVDNTVSNVSERVLPSECEIVEQPEKDGRLVFFQPYTYKSLESYKFAQKDNVQTGPTEDQVIPIFKQVTTFSLAFFLSRCLFFTGRLVNVIFQVVELMAFCHEIGIVVRDLKPRKLVFVDKHCSQLRSIRSLTYSTNYFEKMIVLFTSLLLISCLDVSQCADTRMICAHSTEIDSFHNRGIKYAGSKREEREWKDEWMVEFVIVGYRTFWT